MPDIAKTAVIGNNVTMGLDIVISHFVEVRDHCTIGEGTRIGSLSVLAEGTKIGKHCMIHGGAFFADDRKLNGEHNPPIIRDKVKFGTNVKVMGGIEIGENAIIGANSTVFKDVPAYEVHAGTPARKIRDLKAGEIIL